MNKPTHPIKEAEIRIGGILADEENPCPSFIGDELSQIENLLSEWMTQNGFDETGNPPPHSVCLELFHGRKTKDEELDDWGSAGPIFGPLSFVHTTYQDHIKFEQDGNWHELWLAEGMIFYDGIWYGDWTVFSLDGKDENQLDEIKSRITSYEEPKSKIPNEQ